MAAMEDFECPKCRSAFTVEEMGYCELHCPYCGTKVYPVEALDVPDPKEQT